jgi:hypothetical protein
MWEAGRGHLIVGAILQFPWLSVADAVRPDYRDNGLEDELLTWAIERLTVATAHRGQRSHFLVSAPPMTTHGSR